LKKKPKSQKKADAVKGLFPRLSTMAEELSAKVKYDEKNKRFMPITGICQEYDL
jgi:hypothetical protein